MIIGADVDGTTCNTIFQWYFYLAQRFPYKHIEGRMPYDVSKAFDIPEGVDRMSFWKDPNLYEGLTPIKDSVEVLRKLKDQGNEIVFVSATKGWHNKSKYYWIDKFFPFKDAVLLTKEKHYVKLDVMIDDNPEVLSKMPDNVLTIQFDNGCENTLEYKPHHFCKSWKEVEEILCN